MGFQGLRGTSVSKLAARTTHCKRYHGGRGLPGPVRAASLPFRMLSASEVKGYNFDWKCPLCRYGLPKDSRRLASKHVFEQGTVAHRNKKHADVPGGKYQAAAIAQAQASPLARSRKRAFALNKTRVKLASKAQLPSGYTPLMWPSIRRDRGAPHLLVRSAWSCDVCGHIYATFAKSRVKHFEATEKQARKCKHTLTPAEFETFSRRRRPLCFVAIRPLHDRRSLP